MKINSRILNSNKRINSRRLKSMKVKSRKVKSRKVNSMKVNSMKVNSMKVNSMKVKSRKLNSRILNSRRLRSRRLKSMKVKFMVKRKRNEDDDEKQKFLNEFYLYINNIFGEENVRKKIKNFLDIADKVLYIVTDIDPKTKQRWTHHVTRNLDTYKEICSVQKGHQETMSDDTACQSYSIYNMITENKKHIGNKNVEKYIEKLKKLEDVTIKERKINNNLNPERIKIVRRNTKKVVNLLLWLLKQPEIVNEINDLNFSTHIKDSGILVKGETKKYIINPVPKLQKTLKKWAKDGYIYFV